MDLGLKDKHILVTGSSGGIGSTIVRMLLDEGSIVTGTDIKQMESNNNLSNSNFNFKKANLENEIEVKELFSVVTANKTRIDALILAHGFWYQSYQPLKNLDLDRWNKVISSNLTATMLSVKYFFQNLERFPGKFASIVLLGSTAGIYGLPGFYEYTSAKSALVGLMKALKTEIINYASEGRINMISPGIVNTSMSERIRSNENLLKKNLQVTALAKVAEPSDIASMAVILTSSVSSGHITGENISISGGLEGRIVHELENIKLD